jgi:hypothetical protein
LKGAFPFSTLLPQLFRIHSRSIGLAMSVIQ